MIPLNTRARKVAPLLFGSGLCALIYQVVWTREFRLIFGASTAASAAVLAIFIGGLGIGGLLLGRRADQHPRPLFLYAQLEAMIAISVALTPGFLWVARWLYVHLGGTVALGLGLGTVIRLVLAAVVIGVPTVLMGGTLPAAARAVETDDDARRRHVALLYGVNTLGSVSGCLLATFFLLEVFGDRSTLWVACLLNLALAMIARTLSRLPLMNDAQASDGVASPGEIAKPSAASPGWLVLTAATLVGFAFFLMELVWYRMLGPLLGGTVFTFGLILAIALLGIGLGGTFYSLNRSNRPATLRGFAYTCVLEAACIGIPYALGDRIAVLAVLLRPLGGFGFIGQVAAWSSVAALVVLPAAFVAGFQFPLLIALIGQARRNVGREIGLVYAWNTAGAIGGSLAGGFGLIPALTAPGCWRLVVILLSLLGLAAAVISAARENRWARSLPDGALAFVVFCLIFALGPTAAWRHSPIGAGRVEPQKLADLNGIHDFINSKRMPVHWEAEGVESSVALSAIDGYSFVVNGKVDGNSRLDAPTTVMGGLVGAMLHPKPTSALVIGLGTGSTAGWLGMVPGIERVDAVELEPAILEVARICAPVNAGALNNPKVFVTIGDAREVLLTASRKYDLIFSEPSNPYRAGVASLFTREFYEGVAGRLNDEGIFMQWVQAYEVDGRTLRSVYATIGSVFPEVETWQLAVKDLLLVASRKPLAHDVSSLRSRLKEDPFKTALAATWRVNDLEGFLAHHMAGATLARAVSKKDSEYISTDDRNYIEFGFAQDMGKRANFAIDELHHAARELKSQRPELANGEIDWNRLEERRLDIYLVGNRQPPPAPTTFSSDERNRIRAMGEFLKGNRRGGLALWQAQSREPETINELAFVSEALADAGDAGADRYIEQLRRYQPTEASAIASRLLWKQGHLAEAAQAMTDSLTHFQQDPWAMSRIMTSALGLVVPLASADPAWGKSTFATLQKPFAVMGLDMARMETLIGLSRRLDFKSTCVQALKGFEPHIPWNADLLALRHACYELNHSPELERASSDLDEFAGRAPFSFATGLTRNSAELPVENTKELDATDGLSAVAPTSSTP